MGVTCLIQSDVGEGKSTQHMFDTLTKKIELLGGEKAGSWSIDCETYQQPAGPGESSSKQVYIIHHSEHPSVNFSVFENGTCLVAEDGFDSFLPKLKPFLTPRKLGKLEARGLKFSLGDFAVKIGNLSQGNNFRGFVLEFEYAPCSHVQSAWGILMEFVSLIMESDMKHLHISPQPKTVLDTKTGRFTVADTVLQYVSVFQPTVRFPWQSSAS